MRSKRPIDDPTVGLPFKAAGMYLVFSTLWILSSDKVLHFLVDQEQYLHGFQTLKGLLFVLLSSLLIFGVVRYEVSGRIKNGNSPFAFTTNGCRK